MRKLESKTGRNPDMRLGLVTGSKLSKQGEIVKHLEAGADPLARKRPRRACDAS